jgi:hypothetical protein
LAGNIVLPNADATSGRGEIIGFWLAKRQRPVVA